MFIKKYYYLQMIMNHRKHYMCNTLLENMSLLRCRQITPEDVDVKNSAHVYYKNYVYIGIYTLMTSNYLHFTLNQGYTCEYISSVEQETQHVYTMFLTFKMYLQREFMQTSLASSNIFFVDHDQFLKTYNLSYSTYKN